MSNIERAIERLLELKPWPEGYYEDLNIYRAEIVALMRGASYGGGCAICQAYENELNEKGHGPDCELAALAAKILEGEKL